MTGQLVDIHGDPLVSAGNQELLMKLQQAKRQMLRARFDAAQTMDRNQEHWSHADGLDPHSSASPRVRKVLRNRSRYELVENNAFLKGMALMIANDFVSGGPKLQITDKRIGKDRRQQIENRFKRWFRASRIRQKLWRSRLAKLVDGETFFRAYSRPKRGTPVQLDFQVLEADRVSSSFSQPTNDPREVDGVRFDDFENPLEFHVLRNHPGGSALFGPAGNRDGDWLDAKFIIHWFRQDRGWLRGIPEATPSLPLCAILRRYTHAIVTHAEVSAAFTGFIETEGPANTNPWTDGSGNSLTDDPFDNFPIEPGMLTNLPWGYKFKQFNAVPLGTQYDEFVGACLRQIARPILVPYNLASGSSKDSNMASGVLDQHVYVGGQTAERHDADEVVLDHMLDLWWEEAVLIPGFLGDDFIRTDPGLKLEPPEHKWGWDQVGLEHTDPAKVANALKTSHDKMFMTDRDIQEQYFNRDLEEWQDEVKADHEFRSQFAPVLPEGETDKDAEPGKESASKEEE